MKYTQAETGRIFVLRLENGDIIPDVIEEFANEKDIKAGLVQFLGGADKESKVVVGPEDGSAEIPNPMVTELNDASEALGVGTLFTNEEGVAKLHLHIAFGRKEKTITGCSRKGVKIWHVGEVIIQELVNTDASRKVDKQLGFELLSVKSM